VVPEFKPVTTDIDPHRIVADQADETAITAQCWFTRWKIMDAGIYQKVDGLEPGSTLTFSASVQVWCSDSDDPRADDGELYMRVGIDPTGGTHAFAPSVQWSQWTRGTNVHQRISVTATAERDVATVFVRGWNKWELSHNDAYVDAARLVVVPPKPEEPPTDPEEPPATINERLAAVEGKLAELERVVKQIQDRLG
jgi:hypothetical protein